MFYANKGSGRCEKNEYLVKSWYLSGEILDRVVSGCGGSTLTDIPCSLLV